MLRSVSIAFLLLLVLGAAQASAKPVSVKVPLPGAGQSSAVFANLKGKVTKVAVKGAPKDVTVVGGVKGKSLALAASRPAGSKGSKNPVVVVLKGGRPSLKWTLKKVEKGTVPTQFCTGLTELFAKTLRVPKGTDPAVAAKLGSDLAITGCGGNPQPANGVQLPSNGTGLPAGTTKPATTTPTTPTTPAKPSGGTTTPPADACKNGKDDDGDGQIDARGPGVVNPDSGCSSATDASEGDELLFGDDCAQSSGLFKTQSGGISAAINGSCPLIEEVWMTIRPGVASCTVASADSNYSCAAENGYLHAKRTGGPIGSQLDFPAITLSGPVDCTAKTTITIIDQNGFAIELERPWPQTCAGGGDPDPAQCSNGADDDGDGQADAIGAAGATTPDPGCTSASDTSESSEIAPPAGCTITVGHLESSLADTAFLAQGCGTVVGGWLDPAEDAVDCSLYLGSAQTPTQCDVVAGIGVAAFAPTTQDVLLVAPVTFEPFCDAPLTAAVKRQDGTVIEQRALWHPDGC